MTQTPTSNPAADYDELSDFDVNDLVSPPDEIQDEPTTESHDDHEATTSRRGSGMTRAQVRRIAAKAQEIVEAESRITEIAATLVGSSTDLADLTTAIMMAGRTTTQPVTDLRQIADSDDMQAAILTGALEKPRLRALWALVAALTGAKATLPGAHMQAVLTVAQGVKGLNQDALDDLEAVVTLLAKR